APAERSEVLPATLARPARRYEVNAGTISQECASCASVRTFPGGTSRHGCASPSSAPRPRHCQRPAGRAMGPALLLALALFGLSAGHGAGQLAGQEEDLGRDDNAMRP